MPIYRVVPGKRDKYSRQVRDKVVDPKNIREKEGNGHVNEKSAHRDHLKRPEPLDLPLEPEVICGPERPDIVPDEVVHDREFDRDRGRDEVVEAGKLGQGVEESHIDEDPGEPDEPEPGDLLPLIPDRPGTARDREAGDIGTLPEVIDHGFQMEFALSLLPVLEDEGDLDERAPPALAEDLHQDLVTPRCKRGAGYNLAPHSEEPAHGVGDLREEDASKRGGPERYDPSFKRPLLDIPALHVPAPDGDIGAAAYRLVEFWDEFWWMREVGVDDLEDIRTRCPESLDDRLGETVVLLPHDQAHVVVLARDLLHDRNREVL